MIIENQPAFRYPGEMGGNRPRFLLVDAKVLYEQGAHDLDMRPLHPQAPALDDPGAFQLTERIDDNAPRDADPVRDTACNDNTLCAAQFTDDVLD